MSLFLGKIHFWLYNKILCLEKAQDKIVELAKENGMPIESWMEEDFKLYGKPTGNEPLENIIDQSNIHGWLQEKIKSSELRQASLVTRILNVDQKYKDKLIEIFNKQGEEAALEYSGQANNPEEIYNAANEFVLEGMPCDRAGRIILSTENEIMWTLEVCLHKPYWNEVGGDVENFYELRNAWMSSFVKTLNADFEYKKIEDGTYVIARV